MTTPDHMSYQGYGCHNGGQEGYGCHNEGQEGYGRHNEGQEGYGPYNGGQDLPIEATTDSHIVRAALTLADPVYKMVCCLIMKSPLAIIPKSTQNVTGRYTAPVNHC